MLYVMLLDIGSNFPKPRERENAFATEIFLMKFKNNLRNEKDYSLKILNRLCKKIEVPKKIRAFYKPDLSNSLENTALSTPYTIYLCGVYLFCAYTYRNWRFLNTALKMLEGDLIEPVPNYPEYLYQYSDEILRKLQAELV